jgi:hypothetical protein
LNIEYRSKNIEFGKDERGDISKEQVAVYGMRLFRYILNIKYRSRNIEFGKDEREDISKE